MIKKVKLSFFLPEMLCRDIKAQMIKEGYDLKGKSRWIAEAVNHLFSMQEYIDLVKINDEMKGFEKLESVTIERALKQQLDEAVVSVRMKYPTIEGVQSRILRTAIMQRLIASV